MYCYCTVDVLVRAFESVMTDDSFQLASAPAISARKGAEQVLTWYPSNKDKFASFGKCLFFTLEHCFIADNKKMRTRRERMWEKYYQLRSTDEFARNWETFLQLSGTEASPTLYQHITDLVFNHLISTTFTSATCTPTQATASEIDYQEKNAIRYIAGYVSRSIYRKLTASAHRFKDELRLCLAELNDANPEDMEDDSKDWIKSVDRGGLKHVPDMMYMMFVSMEQELRVQLSCQAPSAVNLIEAKEKLIQNEDVNFYWSMVSSNWQEEVAMVLLDMLVDHWISIRGHSTASAWLEEEKKDKKKTVQKSKGVRKQLLATSSTKSKV